MPIDTRFLNSAKDKAKAVARAGLQFANENPRLSLGSAAAMLLAPAVFKNDQRGYMQTATVTTPLIAASTYAAPSIVGAFRSQFSDHAKPGAGSVSDRWKASNTSKSIASEGMRQATQDFSEQNIPIDIPKDTIRKYYTGRMRKSPNLTAESNALASHLKTRLTGMVDSTLTTSRLTYLSNAIHGAKLSSLNSSDLVAYQKMLDPTGFNQIPPIAPTLTADQIMGAVEPHMTNEAFVRSMNNRLQRMDKLYIGPNSITANNSMVARYSSVSWKNSSALQRSLAAENPQLYHSVQAGITEGRIDPLHLDILTLEESGHPIAALRYKGINGLTIPVVAADGSVKTGEGFRRIGIARKIYTADQVMSSDVYAVEALRRGFGTNEVAEELQRANIYGAVDSSEDFSTLIAPEYGEYINADGAFALRSRSAVPSNLFGFTRTESNGSVSAVGANRLDAESGIQVLTEVWKKHGFTKVGSESGVSKYVAEFGEVAQLDPFGMPNPEKQSPAWRSYTKNIRLTKTSEFPAGSMTKVRDSLRPFFETDYMQRIAPLVDKREIGVRVASITAGEKTLFGDLPETVEGLAGYENTATSILMKERSIDSMAARKAWMELSNWLSNPANLKAMRRLGTLGEGGALMRNNLYGMGVERMVRYDVDEMHIPDWQQHLGTPIEEALGVEKGSKAVLGFQNGNPVTAMGMKNYIENVHDMGNGRLGVEVREVVPFGTGTKFDALVKGLVSGVEDTQMETVKEGLNLYHKTLGTGGFVPREVEQIQVLHYAQNKTNPLSSIMNIAGDTMRRLEESGELDEVKPYMEMLENKGLIYDRGTLTFETAALKAANKEELRNQSLDIIEQMFRHVADRIEKGQIQGDEFMRHFALSGESSYQQFVHRYASPTTLRVWNTTQWNVPEDAKVTYDMLQQLAAKGYHGAAKDLLSRVKYDGDPTLTHDLERYLSGDTGAISGSRTLADSLGPNGQLMNMSSPEGRAGTIFDPGMADENFMMKLPDGTEVPVLGHKAYGGKVNRYGTAQYSASEHESALMNMMRLYTDGGSAGKIESARNTYIDSLKQFVHGKNSYFRAASVDDDAALGKFIQTRASTLRYADGSVNPFEMGIGRDLVSQIKDEGIRNALLSGEDVFAAIARHPVSDMPFMKVVVDDTLNRTNLLGIDEGMRGLIMADDDEDMASIFFMRKRMGGYKEAANAVYGVDTTQRSALEFQQALEGIADDPRSYFTKTSTGLKKAGASMKDLKIKDLFAQLRDARGSWTTPVALDEALRARSTSSSIGAFSNTLTQMMIGLENNTGVTSLSKKRELMRFMFTSIRQGPISASKLKNIGAVRPMDQARALGIDTALRKNLGPGGDFDKFYSALGELADATDAGKIVEGRNAGPFRNYLADNRDTFRAYFRGFDKKKVAQARTALTTPSENVSSIRQLGMDSELMPYLFAAAAEEPSVTEATGHAAAEASARAIGGILNRIKTAAAEAEEGFRLKKVGIVVGTGIAIAMAAGVATTSFTMKGAQAAFGQGSSSQYHPEDGAGVSGGTPGSAWEGSRAARPRRASVASPQQARSTMVAPVGETADMDVRMRTPDKSRAQETAKMLRRIATDGDSNVTINYRESKRQSLRARERMKDALDQ